MPARAHGLDLSKWNLNFKPQRDPPLPIDFVIQRVSYGVIPDERLVEIHHQIKPIALRGAYHYFSSAAGWQAQADHFLELVTRLGGYDFYALDFERDFNKRSAGFANGARLWIERVAQEMGKRTLLYTNPAIYKDWLLPYGSWMVDYPLWIAQYWWLPSPEKNPGMKSMKRTDWSFYQYTKRGDGQAYGSGGNFIDLDVFNGTVEDLQAWTQEDGGNNRPTPVSSYSQGYQQALTDISNELANLRIEA